MFNSDTLVINCDAINPTSERLQDKMDTGFRCRNRYTTVGISLEEEYYIYIEYYS